MAKILLTRGFWLFVVGVLVGVVLVGLSARAIHITSDPQFCMSCHEMRIVGEQGWMYSPHYQNAHGVVAECTDCHVPPGVVATLWTKTRDGLKDIVVHTLGNPNPALMDWDHLAEQARSKIRDEACLRCHENLTPKGASIKQLIAHREYLRLGGEKRCLDCHTEEFHGRFREMLPTPEELAAALQSRR